MTRDPQEVVDGLVLDLRTPVQPGGIALWEREVARETKAVEQAQARLDYAKRYLAALKAQAAQI